MTDSFVLPSDAPDPSEEFKLPSEDSGSAPFALPSEAPQPSVQPSPLAKAVEPITSYPSTYNKMRHEAQDQVGQGVKQLTNPSSGWDVAKGIGNVGLGTVGYFASPINAGLRTVVGKPIEENFGIPKEYTEFAAGLGLPGIGLTRGATAAAKSVVPTTEAIKDAAKAAYKSPEVAGLQLDPKTLPQLGQTIAAKLTSDGFHPVLAPKTHGVLDQLTQVPAGTPYVTADNIQSLRRVLGKAAQSTDPTERTAAQMAQRHVDNFMANIPPQSVQAGDAVGAAKQLEEARNNYAAAMRGEKFQGALDKADRQAARAGTGGNLENATRQRITSILNSDKQLRGFSAEERKAMEDYVQGTFTRNTLRALTKILGGDNPLMASTHVALAWPTSGLSLLAPPTGYILKRVGNAISNREIQRVDELIRSRSPLAQKVAGAAQQHSTVGQQWSLNPTTKNATRFALASSDLSNRLRAIGVNIDPKRLMNPFQSPGPAGAEEPDQQPDQTRAFGGRVLVNTAVPAIRKYDVPYLAGAANDGKAFYIDRRVPNRIKLGKHHIDPAVPLRIHELTEWHLMTKKGVPYKDAHKVATAKEREWVEGHGHSWKLYEEVMDGLLSHIEHENPKNPPPNLYLKPYPHDKQKLLERNRAWGGSVLGLADGGSPDDSDLMLPPPENPMVPPQWAQDAIVPNYIKQRPLPDYANTAPGKVPLNATPPLEAAGLGGMDIASNLLPTGGAKAAAAVIAPRVLMRPADNAALDAIKAMRWYHGAKEEFNKFNIDKTIAMGEPDLAVAFTNRPEVAQEYAQNYKKPPGPLIEAELPFTNPKVIERKYPRTRGGNSLDIERAANEGHDGLVYKYTHGFFPDHHEALVFGDKNIDAIKILNKHYSKPPVQGFADGGTPDGAAVQDPFGPTDEMPAPPEQQPKFVQKLFGLDGQERYQTWPEKMVRSAVTLPGDVLSGQVPDMTGLRREDFTDQPVPSKGEGEGGLFGNHFFQPVAAQPTDEMIQRTQDLAGMAGSGGLGAAEKGAVGVFGGKLAKTADLPKLKLAQAMTENGADKAYVWRETGWFQGNDGHWRFEIPDTGVKADVGKLHRAADTDTTVPLEEAMPHPELYKAYPELAQTPTRAVTDLNYRDYGAFSHDTATPNDPGQIDLNFAYPNERINSTALHETQHAIQRQEGFEPGGNSRNFEAQAKVLLDAAKAKVANLDRQIAVTPQEAARAPLLAQRQELSDLLTQVKGNKIQDWSREQYHKLMGEVEPRNVEYRANMTPEERLNNPPWQTEDVPRSQQLRAQPGILRSDSSEAGAPLSALAKNPFYSAVEKAVANAPQQKMHASQWLGWLKNQLGVKAEELSHLGLDTPDVLGNGLVTKDQVLAHVKDNGIQLGEVDKRTRDLSKEDYTDKLNELAEEYYNRPYDELDSDLRLEIRGALEDQQLLSKSATKYSKYQLPGGENYQEKLLTLPEKPPNSEGWTAKKNPGESDWSIFDKDGKLVNGTRVEAKNEKDAIKQAVQTAQLWGKIGEPRPFRSGHWDEPNVVGHLRMNDREIPGVGKSLHIEEAQSDWHQEGRKYGYANDLITGEKAKEIEDRAGYGVDSGPLNQTFIKAIKEGRITPEEARQHRAYIQSHIKEQIPNAPFKTTWSDLLLKRAIAKAAHEGYDSISWTPGEQQAARYDLSKQVDRLQYHPDTNDLIAEKNGRVLIDKKVAPEELPAAIGKDAADKLLNNPTRKTVTPAFKVEDRYQNGQLIPGKTFLDEGEAQHFAQHRGQEVIKLIGPQTGLPVHSLEGVDLKVGGEGMKSFYDKMLVDKANAIGKKYGAKVEWKPLGAETASNFKASETFPGSGHWGVELPNGQSAPYTWRSQEAALENAQRIYGGSYSKPTEANIKVPVLRLTPKLKEQALTQGFPLFADSGKVGAPLSALEHSYVPEGYTASKARSGGYSIYDPNGKKVAWAAKQEDVPRYAQQAVREAQTIKDTRKGNRSSRSPQTSPEVDLKPIPQVSSTGEGQGWWYNQNTRKAHTIDPGELGPHGDHDGWIALGDNAEKLGVNKQKAAAFQAATYGGTNKHPDPRVRELAEKHGDDIGDGEKYIGGDLTRYGTTPEQDAAYQKDFKRLFGVSAEKAWSQSFPELVRVRRWPGSKGAPDALSVTLDNFGALKSSRRFVDDFLKQNPDALKGVGGVDVHTRDGTIKRLSPEQFLSGNWTRKDAEFRSSGIGSPATANNQQQIPGPIADQQDEGQPQHRAHGGRVNPDNINHKPTEAQKASGAYAKDHISIHGLPITIENAKGSIRSGIGPNGVKWSSALPAHYGYFKQSEGADGDHVDVYLGPHLKSQLAYIIDQRNHETGKFDEHKIGIGFGSARQFLNTYERAFSDGKGKARIGAIHSMTLSELKGWLEHGDTKVPYKPPNMAKLAHSAVAYEPKAANYQHRCDACIRFVPANLGGPDCVLVTKPVSPSGWCNKFRSVPK